MAIFAEKIIFFPAFQTNFFIVAVDQNIFKFIFFNQLVTQTALLKIFFLTIPAHKIPMNLDDPVSREKIAAMRTKNEFFRNTPNAKRIIPTPTR